MAANHEAVLHVSDYEWEGDKVEILLSNFGNGLAKELALITIAFDETGGHRHYSIIGNHLKPGKVESDSLWKIDIDNPNIIQAGDQEIRFTGQSRFGKPAPLASSRERRSISFSRFITDMKQRESTEVKFMHIVQGVDLSGRIRFVELHVMTHPQEVVESIMDGAEYDVGVSAERLNDPACGSGTFLVEAVNRYLTGVRRYNDHPDWKTHLMELCSLPHIVGLDIHPFAVLMAQIRFMLAILPEYREAKRENPQFTIRRLPIFRTDSLRNERKNAGIDLGDEGNLQLTFDALTEDNQDVLIPVPLPIEHHCGRFGPPRNRVLLAWTGTISARDGYYM